MRVGPPPAAGVGVKLPTFGDQQCQKRRVLREGAGDRHGEGTHSREGRTGIFPAKKEKLGFHWTWLHPLNPGFPPEGGRC